MKNVAIFDFDNTIIEGDSFMPFLTYACGVLPAYAAGAAALVHYGVRRLQKKPTESLRTFVKAFMLRELLGGKKVEDLEEAAFRTRAWQKVNDEMMEALKGHRAKGDTIVIASGSLDLYLGELVRDIPHEAIICTDVEVKDGVVTGEMINGNCVRLCKAVRVKEWLEKNGPFGESFGYGNYPHDMPMLNLVKHRVIVS